MLSVPGPPSPWPEGDPTGDPLAWSGSHDCAPRGWLVPTSSFYKFGRSWPLLLNKIKIKIKYVYDVQNTVSNTVET